MRRNSYSPVKQQDMLSNSGSATGQKDYALACKRAKRLQFEDASGIKHIDADAPGADMGLVQKRFLFPRKS